MVKILVIDDSRLFQMSTEKLLVQAGCKVFLASDGEEAIKIAKMRKPDIILLDIEMPKMNGIVTCEALKQDPKTSSIPIIMCTSHTRFKDIDAAFDKGAVDYIFKPIDSERLKNKIAKYCS